MDDRQSRVRQLLNEGIELSRKVGKEIDRLGFGFTYSRCCDSKVIRKRKGMIIDVCSKCGQPVSKLRLK